MMENSEYNGRKRTPAEEWGLYKMLKPVVTAMVDQMQWVEDPTRQEEVETVERNDEAARARVEVVEDQLVESYNLEWLNELIECSKYDTLDQFLHAFEADKATVRLLREACPKKEILRQEGKDENPSWRRDLS